MGIRLGLTIAQRLGHGILDTFGKDKVIFFLSYTHAFVEMFTLGSYFYWVRIHYTSLIALNL